MSRAKVTAGPASDLIRRAPIQPIGRPGPIPGPGTGPAPNPQNPGPPTIDGIGRSSGLPGDSISIVGSGLMYTSAVVFNNAQGLTGAYYFVASDVAVTAFVPNLMPGPANIFIETTPPMGSPQSSNEVGFLVLKPVSPPTLDPNDPFDPKGAAVGQSVTIHGQNLGQVNEVFFNGTQATSVTPIGGRMFTAVVPYGASTGPIRVVAPAGEATSGQNFVVVTAPPAIANIVPDSGKPGAKVEIDGTQLLVATVTFGGVVATLPQKAERRLKAIVPQLPPGPTTVMATNALGSSQFPFTVT